MRLIQKLVELITGIPAWLMWVIVGTALMIIANMYVDAKVQEGRDEVQRAYEKKLHDQSVAYDLAVQQQEDESTEVINGIALKLHNALAQAREKQIIIKEVTKYVTTVADQQCTIPNGFVWLHDRTLAGESTEATQVPDSGPRDVDAASGVALSTVAATVGENYTECVTRGKIIDQWQQWYVQQKGIYERAQRIIEAAAVAQ